MFILGDLFDGDTDAFREIIVLKISIFTVKFARYILFISANKGFN